MTLHIDIETFSECDLKSAGVYRYAEHPSTEVLCVGYRVNNGPYRLWIPGDCPIQIAEAVMKRCPDVQPIVGPRPPKDFLAAWALEPKRAHNAQFERVVLNGVAGAKLGIRRSEIKEWTCTAVKAAANGLPRDLASGAKALGTHPKSEAGRIEMLQLAKPRKPTKADPSTRWTFANAPDKWINMLCYNVDDVKAEYELDEALPDLEAREQELYHLDQKINERGWAVDLKAVNDILYVVEQYKAELAAEFRVLTADWLGNGLEPTQREKIAEWIREQGYRKLPDMTKDTVAWVVKQDGVPTNIKRALRIYSTYNAKSVSKLQAMLDAVCADGRLRGMFLFYGAATGRWSSLIVQLQNMMRPLIKDPNAAIETFALRDLTAIRMLWPDVDPMKVAGSCIRGCLVAADGSDLIFPDFSGIEDRVNAWTFDEEWVLDAYRAYDAGKGRHLYSITVCRSFGLDLATFDDEDPRRQQGKVQRLALGYEGGVAAFATMAETYGVDLEELAAAVNPLLPDDARDHAAWMWKHHPSSQPEHIDRACNGLKYLWRRDHPHIVQGWKDLKHAAESATEFEGKAFWLPNKKAAFKVEEFKGRKWLSMRLPSGRKVKYYSPQWHPPTTGERYINNELVEYTIPGYMDYLGTDTYTRQWMRLQTYGGKLCENFVQATSRELMANAMLNLDAAGFHIVGSEHDKVICEIGPAVGEQRVLSNMLEQPPVYAGLPLATDGKRLKRYGK